MKTKMPLNIPANDKRLDRAKAYAQHIVDHNATIRATAQYFNVPHSTVHYYIHNYLGAAATNNRLLIAGSRILYNQVLEVFDAHISRVRAQLPIIKKQEAE